ncbi:MAG: type II toxin-antitoxin system prevent-host-death family antitoxin [Caldilineaceae bacterium]|nr:type II toxin-antitoxin system prevent-host-death family antitoxin [Caldilineaceae bacterium]
MTLANVNTDQQIGIRELKNNLSAYLKQVKAGATLTITDHGEPIGQLVPIQKSVEARLQELTAAGLLVWNGEPYKPTGPDLRPTLLPGTPQTAADILLEDRN